MSLTQPRHLFKDHDIKMFLEIFLSSVFDRHDLHEDGNKQVSFNIVY